MLLNVLDILHVTTTEFFCPTLKEADKILVIDNGKIVSSGKHEELLENSEIYKEIALSQLSKEEL